MARIAALKVFESGRRKVRTDALLRAALRVEISS
jgi:hypothetical protein